MKIIDTVDSIFSLFQQKVNIRFMHAGSGMRMNFDNESIDLPEAFDKPSILTIKEKKWRVMKADIVDSYSYFKKKVITLHIAELDDPLSAITHPVPTQASSPVLTANSSLTMERPSFKGMPIPGYNYLFYSIEYLPLLQEMTDNVLVVLEAASSNPLLGYNDLIRREQLEGNNLRIDFEEFCKLINNPTKGTIMWENNSYIEKGFSIASEHYTYYGTLDEENKIKQLSIQQFDYVTDELTNILSEYQLLLVDWCNGSIIS